MAGAKRDQIPACILSIERWVLTGMKDRLNAASSVYGVLKSRYESHGLDDAGIHHLPLFRDNLLGWPWLLIPGGDFTMGLSTAEEFAARAIEDPPPLSLDEMRPCRTVHVPPFLMMQYPVSVDLAERVLNVSLEDQGPQFPGPKSLRPVYLSKKQADNISKTAEAALPDETQWEYACRAGTKTLFFFGNSLPKSTELERLVSADFGPAAKATPNPFGLFGLFTGEWCGNHFAATYRARSARSRSFAIRGGASAFWPWQQCGEWAFCVSAMRMPSSDLASGLCGVRLVRPL